MKGLGHKIYSNTSDLKITVVGWELKVSSKGFDNIWKVIMYEKIKEIKLFYGYELISALHIKYFNTGNLFIVSFFL